MKGIVPFKRNHIQSSKKVHSHSLPLSIFSGEAFGEAGKDLVTICFRHQLGMTGGYQGTSSILLRVTWVCININKPPSTPARSRFPRRVQVDEALRADPNLEDEEKTHVQSRKRDTVPCLQSRMDLVPPPDAPCVLLIHRFLTGAVWTSRRPFQKAFFCGGWFSRHRGTDGSGYFVLERGLLLSLGNGFFWEQGDDQLWQVPGNFQVQHCNEVLSPPSSLYFFMVFYNLVEKRSDRD